MHDGTAQPPSSPQETPAPSEAHTGHHEHPHPQAVLPLALAALGVVYGDIGTSPLYALRESFHGPHAIEPTQAHIYGVLSLVLWSLIIVITIKYVSFILRADNRGEGGILAITALATPIRPLRPTRPHARWILILGVIGAALLYGDGVITPAISVLSAVEGLKVAAPGMQAYVVPITVVIIIGLFLIQSRGTAQIGGLFGPVMLVWFTVLGILGVVSIAQTPEILMAANPLYGLQLFITDGWKGFLIMGTVFLVVTGGEALYADMGHFGRKPIQIAWFALVLPGLTLNYFGQGALLLRSPESAENLFYLLAPSWALYPMVLLSTMATIIASQALISGAFSLTMQAENLGMLPRMRIVHTSATSFGQIYIPLVNWALMVACIAVVVGFGTSSNLAAAYGIAVTATMVITTLIFGVVARRRWRWSALRTALVVGFFLIVDLAFLGANLLKIPQGGWFTLVVAAVIFTVMMTWRKGSRLVNEREQNLERDLAQLLEEIRTSPPKRAAGAAIFLSANPESAPAALVANMHYNGGVLHEHVVLVTVVTEEIPHIRGDRVTATDLGQGFHHVRIRYGFMEEPNVPQSLAQLSIPGVALDAQQGPYFTSRTKAIPTNLPGMAPWREQIYSLMQRNAISAADFFRLPPSRVVEIGTSVEL
jgi:KUP system potassium uptake protein